LCFYQTFSFTSFILFFTMSSTTVFTINHPSLDTSESDGALAIMAVKEVDEGDSPPSADTASVESFSHITITPPVTPFIITEQVARPEVPVLFGADLVAVTHSDLDVQELYLKYTTPFKLLAQSKMAVPDLFLLVAAIMVDARLVYKHATDNAQILVIKVIHMAISHHASVQRANEVVALVEPMMALATFYVLHLKPTVLRCLSFFPICGRKTPATLAPTKTALRNLNLPTPRSVVRRARVAHTQRSLYYNDASSLHNAVHRIAAQASSISAVADALYELFEKDLANALAPKLHRSAKPWPQLVASLMVALQQYKVDGTIKKELVLAILAKTMVNHVPLEDHDAVNRLVAEMISPAIDAAIAFSHNLPIKLYRMCCA
jgi:hypothetical protein